MSISSIEHFKNQTEKGQFVTLKGEWPTSSALRFVTFLISPSLYYQRLTSIFIAHLDAIERESLDQRKVEACIMAGETLLTRSKSSKLMQRLCSLKYRAERLVKNEIDPHIYQELEIQLKQWKGSQSFYAVEQRSLCERDERVLNEICRYGEFAKLVREDCALRELFFRWTIRDNNQVEIFVEFPAIYKRINSVLLSSRVGRFSGQILTVERKDVFLRFQVENKDKSLECRKFSVLDESQILTVRGGGKWSIKQIFDQVFAKKNDEIGDFEVFSTGIIPWNAHELGYFSSRQAEYIRTDFTAHDWWEKLPVFEVIEQKELERRTGLSLEGMDAWGVVMAKASRKFPKLDIDKCHGFLGIAIKQSDGRFRIYDFGKFPTLFPRTRLDYIRFLADTVLAKIEYPDTNNFYSDRQIATVGEILDPEKGEKLMQLVARDLTKARENKLIFQFGWENCAFWPQRIFNELFGDVVENFYRIPILTAEISNFVLNLLIKAGQLLPQSLQSAWVVMILWLLGYERGIVIEEEGKMVKKCLYNAPFNQSKHTEVYQHFHCPAHMHKLIEQKEVLGVILGGHSL